MLKILAEIGPVQEVLDAHDGVVTVLDTSDGNIMLSLDGGCTGCSSTPMTAMQLLLAEKLDAVNDVIFVNGELPEYMRTFINQKMEKEAAESSDNGPGESFDHSSSTVLPMLCGFAPNDTFSPLMFMRAAIAKTMQTMESGVGGSSTPTTNLLQAKATTVMLLQEEAL